MARGPTKRRGGSFYDKDNMANILLRVPLRQYWTMFWQLVWYRYSMEFQTHPMVMGFFRRFRRGERRPILERESWPAYALRRARTLKKQVVTIYRLFFEFQELWLLTRRQQDPRWAFLAELRGRLADAQRRVAESDVAARCDLALGELRETLRVFADRLELSSRSQRAFGWFTRRRLARKAREIKAYLRETEWQVPSWQHVVQAEHYLRESVVGGYEELAIRYVAQRRRFNTLRADFVAKVKSGRPINRELLTLPAALAFEIFVGLRFSIATLRGL